MGEIQPSGASWASAGGAPHIGPLVLDRHRLCVSSETNPKSQDNKSQARRPVLATRTVSYPWSWKCGKFKTSESQMSSNRERPHVWGFTGKVAHKALGMLSGDLAWVSTTLKLDP